MTTKKRSVLMSVLTIMLSLALFAGGTYALFTEEVTFTNHLQAGTMDVTLTRTYAETLTLDPKTGFMVRNTLTDPEPFTSANDKNVFGLADGELIVPGCKYSATLNIKNDEAKSDVAFDYWVQIVYKGDLTLDLANQLKISVKTGSDKTEETLLSTGLTLGKKGDPLGTLAKGDSESFTVTVEFVDNDNINNDAQGQALNFDIVVHAVQSLRVIATSD